MNASAKAVMDAAERHMCVGGLSGFSFRDIAAEIGMKSSSVHYHFPIRTARQRDYGLQKTLGGVFGSTIVRTWTARWADSLTDRPMVGKGTEFIELRPDGTCCR